MKIIDQTKVMDINHTKPNTVYNINFKWPETSQKVSSLNLLIITFREIHNRRCSN